MLRKADGKDMVKWVTLVCEDIIPLKPVVQVSSKNPDNPLAMAGIVMQEMMLQAMPVKERVVRSRFIDLYLSDLEEEVLGIRFEAGKYYDVEFSDGLIKVTEVE